MRPFGRPLAASLILCALIVVVSAATGSARPRVRMRGFDATIQSHARSMLDEGRETFRFDTFGDEDFWGGQLHLHEAVAQAKPRDALGLGLKVDSDALSAPTRHSIARGAVDLDDPAVTRELLRRDAVVGVKGFFDDEGNLTSIGITCALCHSTVDDAIVPGVGRRLDGWANRDLDVGKIVNLSPTVAPLATVLGVDEPAVRSVLTSWGPGKFDAALILDRKSGPTLIPPAYGLAGVNLHTWTGWGSVTHWNAFVAVLEMHGKGTFFDPRLSDAAQFPVAAQNGFGDVRSSPDLVTPKLAALHVYQLDIPAPAPPLGSFNAGAAARGDALFSGKAGCARCHVEPLYTEPGWNMHTPAEIGIEATQADRAPDKRYRTSPLKGLWAHGKGGFYHDGRFPTLRAVVDHYDAVFTLGLTDAEKSDLVEYLKSL